MAEELFAHAYAVLAFPAYTDGFSRSLVSGPLVLLSVVTL